MSQDRIDVLRRSDLMQGMSDAEICELLQSSHVREIRCRKGDILFHEGDMPKEIYLLLAGEVHILKDTFAGRRIFISEIDAPGDLFGEVYEALQKPYDMYVEAVTDTDILCIGNAFFRLESDTVSPAAAHVRQNLLRIFARKAYAMHNRIKVLASGSLRGKIARFLLPQLDANGEVMLQVSREYLAAYLAVTRPSLSRELSSMQNDGILRVSGRKVRVLDPEKLEEFL